MFHNVRSSRASHEQDYARDHEIASTFFGAVHLSLCACECSVKTDSGLVGFLLLLRRDRRLAMGCRSRCLLTVFYGGGVCAVRRLHCGCVMMAASCAAFGGEADRLGYVEHAARSDATR